ncbi:MAG: hypothetical protein A2Z91_02980 [Deltaproteobacteria bacterium GWA2_38_16]|nr:MAG: hypothetical protein A2Z91_02980 [Deltaproteobacteria bacterium GWA2_38_16]OGQ02851.1 MAG: hypothetical protein A3D19_06405 [Deltaproteobacteria bacterium RIFCSPHIGHO2_02_FULL_38_15]OGQ35128.1 MAG: hypothetical protein A3A72_03780 [Deltaproteobacteria bacterium RIFCSPLOWO2_01_FULL_38_9]
MAQTETTALKTTPFLKWTTLSAIPVGLLGHGFIAWWRHGLSPKFRLDEKEGFFGASSYSGGSDKLGHLFANCFISKLTTDVLISAGENKDNALLYSSLVTGISYTLVEVFDGFLPSYGAGLWDMVFDVGGIALNFAEKKYPTFDQLFNFSASYWPSPTFIDLPTHNNFSEDYSGITYYADFNFMRLMNFGTLNTLAHLPQFSLAFHTQGFSPREQQLTTEYSLGLGIDMVPLIERWYNRPYLKDIFSSIKIIPMWALYTKKYHYIRDAEGGRIRRL